MTEQQAIPANLGDIPPGPELGALLAGLDAGRLTDRDLMVVLAAEQRQLAHQQARFWAGVAEVGARDRVFAAIAEGAAQPGQRWCTWDLRAELGWSHAQAGRELAIAEAIHNQMPAVWAALAAGRIDRTRALVFHHECSILAPALQAKILRDVLPHAGGITASWLRTKISALVKALDPGAAERAYTAAVTTRQVVHFLDQHGTVQISLEQLPVTDAAAAIERIDTLARAAKRAGVPARLPHLRADIAVGLLNGRFHAMTQPDIINTLRQHYTPTTEGTEAGPGIPESAAEESTAEESVTAESAADESAAAAVTNIVEVEESEPGNSGDAAPTPVALTPELATQRIPHGTEIRVGLATLLGLDDKPAEIPGLGWIPAHAARDLTAAQHTGQWWFAILDTAGRLTFHGITRHRPTPLAHPAQARGGVVEIHLSHDLLTELAARAAEFPDWANLIGDLTRQYQRRAALTPNPAARFPGPALRRYLHIRDRYCTFLHCHAPARKGDIDHLHDHAKGGPTTPTNLGTPCRRDHNAHTRAGWKPARHPDGTFTWHSPTGRTYHRPPPPIAPPHPDPLPTTPAPDRHPRHPDKPDVDTADTDPNWAISKPGQTPRPPPAEAPASEPVDESDEPPPF